MTENGEPIHELGIQDAEGNFTALAALDYDTVNDELSLKHLQQNVELRTDGTSWNPNRPLGDETQPVPGTSHLESASLESTTVGGVPSDRHWELIDSISVNGELDETVSVPSEYQNNVKITWVGLETITSSTSLNCQAGGITTDNYDYRAGSTTDTSYTVTTSDDKFRLFTADGTDGSFGEVLLADTRGRIGISGRGSTWSSGGRILDRGRIHSQTSMDQIRLFTPGTEEIETSDGPIRIYGTPDQ